MQALLPLQHQPEAFRGAWGSLLCLRTAFYVQVLFTVLQTLPLEQDLARKKVLAANSNLLSR